jgi:uncharacterized membrane protein
MILVNLSLIKDVMKIAHRLIIAILVLLSVVIIAVFVWTCINGPVFCSLEGLSQQGDFIGGHLSALFGCLTLIVVLAFGWHQRKEDNETRKRESFLAGLDLIAQYDLKEPGCEQAMRILDYYSKLAIEDGKEEWLWMLNVVITKEIRKKLEDAEAQEQEVYPHAQEARAKIQLILECYHKKRKGII